MKKLLALATLATALFATRASAAQNLDEKYLTVNPDSASFEEIIYTPKGGGPIPVSTGAPVLPQPPVGPVIPQDNTQPGPSTLDQVNGVVDTIDKIVNLVDKIFGIIAKNQPVVNINVNYANAVPFGTSHWTQLQGWSKPATRRYAFRIENLYGMEVVKVIYQVQWIYGGNFNGKGKFLTGVTVEPLSVDTAWGYNVDLTAEVPDSTVANVGTASDPIASMQVQLKWKVHTIVKDMQQKSIYYVQGDGYMKQIGGASKSEKAAQKKLEAVTERLNNFKF
jgi:hypothetical protein